MQVSLPRAIHAQPLAQPPCILLAVAAAAAGAPCAISQQSSSPHKTIANGKILDHETCLIGTLHRNMTVRWISKNHRKFALHNFHMNMFSHPLETVNPSQNKGFNQPYSTCHQRHILREQHTARQTAGLHESGAFMRGAVTLEPGWTCEAHATRVCWLQLTSCACLTACLLRGTEARPPSASSTSRVRSLCAFSGRATPFEAPRFHRARVVGRVTRT